MSILVPAQGVIKTPYEVIDLAANFDVCFEGARSIDTMVLVSVTAVIANTGVDASSTVIAASPAPSIPVGTRTVAFTVQAGSNGTTYTISIKIQDSTTSEQYEGQMALMVRSI